MPFCDGHHIAAGRRSALPVSATNKTLRGGLNDRTRGIAVFGFVCRHLWWVRLRKLGSHAITELRVFVTANTARAPHSSMLIAMTSVYLAGSGDDDEP